MHPDAYQEMADTEARHWWFRGRRSVLNGVLQSLSLPMDARILEVGCGTGGNLAMLQRFGTVSAMEMNDAARAIAQGRVGARVAIRPGSCPADIPFAQGQFDLVCLFDVLEHIDDDGATLTALRGLLAPGGRLLLTVPAYPWMWSSHDEFLHHKRRYQCDGLRQLFRDRGLVLQRLTHFNALLLPLAMLARLASRLSGDRVARGTSVPTAPVNALFTGIFCAETPLLRFVNLPVGLSLLAVTTAA